VQKRHPTTGQFVSAKRSSQAEPRSSAISPEGRKVLAEKPTAPRVRPVGTHLLPPTGRE
jgi:hypothetical protein